MNLLDSSCWLEYFADGPNAQVFRKPIEDTQNLLVPTTAVLEVFKRTLQQRDEEASLRAIAQMEQGGIVDPDSPIALSAARIGCERKPPLADSVILATALAHDATLWTQDSRFESMEKVRYLPGRTS
jgi:predicted nucleic acid-binding protein